MKCCSQVSFCIFVQCSYKYLSLSDLLFVDFHFRLALGSELLYQRSGGMQATMISLGGFYKADSWEASARLGIHAWSINYHHLLDKNFMLMTSLEGSLMQVIKVVINE